MLGRHMLGISNAWIHVTGPGVEVVLVVGLVGDTDMGIDGGVEGDWATLVENIPMCKISYFVLYTCSGTDIEVFCSLIIFFT